MNPIASNVIDSGANPGVGSVHDTIVVCRPNQLREAAVVLSCCPHDRFTPLIVLEFPPITEAEYRELHEQYRLARNQRDAEIGGQLGRTEVLRGNATRFDNHDIDQKAETLTPYRSWWRHQQLIGELLEKLPLRRAIFLFEPDPAELRLINPVPLNQILEQRRPIIPEGIDWTFLVPASSSSRVAPATSRHVYASLSELTDVAWRLCTGSSSSPVKCVEVSEHDFALYFPGLFRSLQLGLPLRPTGVPRQDLETACAESNATVSSSDEAVLIEASDNAIGLLGVLYAHSRRAKLLVYPEPDLAPVEAARLGMELSQEETAKAKRYVTAHRDEGLHIEVLDQQQRSFLKSIPRSEVIGDVPEFEEAKFLGALRQFLFPNGSGAGLRRIEDAVSALVPDYVVREVADRNLTAMTSGLPYNFVNKNGQNWSAKAIGHVVGDPSLLILTELCQCRDNESVGFNLIFDPGYFETTETRDVLNELRKRLSYPLVLSGDAGSSLALIHFSETLPLEVVFFNTHGSAQSIVLKDMPLPAFKLVQRVNLKSRPIVFNNSCLSWVGVGREFVRTGARSYIGTLWSVDAEMAAKYAQTVLARLNENVPVSQAMRNTRVDPETERAYVFIGTAQTRVGGILPAQAESQRRRLVEACRWLLLSALKLFDESEGHSDIGFLTSIEDLLIAESESLLSRLEHHWPEPHLDHLELLILYLKLLAHLVHRNRNEVERKIGTIDRAGRLLDVLQLETKSKAQHRSQWLQFAGRIYLRLGRLQQAVEFLSESARTAESIGDSAGPQYLELSDAYKLMGHLPKALEAAEKAYHLNTQHGSVEGGELMALGRLAQIANRLNRREVALRYAEEGFILATKRGHLREQAEFKADEARAHLGLRQYDPALQAANDSLRYARLAHDDHRELSAYGTMIRILIRKGDFDAALQNAQNGLQQARRRGILSEIGDFLFDIAEIKSRTGNFREAFSSVVEAAPLFLSIGQISKVRNCLELASDVRDKLNNWEALSRMVRLEVSVIDALEWRLRRQITMDVVTRLKGAISRSGFAPRREQIHTLAAEIGAAVLNRGGDPSEQLQFIVRVLNMLDAWASGGEVDALQEADALDRISAGGFQFRLFLEAHSK